MSRRGNPYDNAMAENFFSILKTECIYRTKLKTYEDALILISEYIHFCNNERIQLNQNPRLSRGFALPLQGAIAGFAPERGFEGLATHYSHWQPLPSGCFILPTLSCYP
ncbi:MAG: IS3 family transposase [Clostridia bacterium]|nr:IS3 family transposase [Clostridia bacterium]